MASCPPFRRAISIVRASPTPPAKHSPFRWIPLLLLEPLPLFTKALDLCLHPLQQKFSRCGRYAGALPKKESGLPEWQTVIEVLMLCSRGGDAMLARIGVMRALNRHVERVFNPDRKETHWGKRKLKRDQ